MGAVAGIAAFWCAVAGVLWSFVSGSALAVDVRHSVIVGAVLIACGFAAHGVMLLNNKRTAAKERDGNADR
ncbi:hypothetical protein [Novosphingobium sp. FKTRR1]|uniref:hypothetical protein n=1 Tax=Novosphingobium sp. FKTRR1 TaxID=2879118 RepID=UPI001CF0B96F|nr:hypothetical protein [Novosphingobium sp. FKTRR1]